jgi:hypothetical protein
LSPPEYELPNEATRTEMAALCPETADLDIRDEVAHSRRLPTD